MQVESTRPLRAIDPARSASDGAVKKISPSKWPSFKDLWCAGVGSEPTSPISPKPTGATLGGYRLDGHEFGAGGYGRVLRAVHGRSGEVVAIKEMDETQVKLPSIIREVGALKRLGDKCEHVAGFRGYHVVGPKHYLIMEALPGGELFHHVTKADGCVAEGECRRLFSQVLSGLREAHAAGIAHRDLKLENIVLTADGRAKLVDFGLCALHRPDGRGGFEPLKLHDYCGSRSYCAPEMAARVPYDGFAADAWSYGVCVFAAAAGFFPFEDASSRDWRFTRACRAQAAGASVTRTIFGFYQRPVPLSAELVALLDGLLQADPRRRLSLAAAAASPWFAGGGDAAPLAAWLAATDVAAVDEAPPAAPAAASLEVDVASLELVDRSPPPGAHAHMNTATASDFDDDDEPVYRDSGGDGGRPSLGPPALARRRARSNVV